MIHGILIRVKEFWWDLRERCQRFIRGYSYTEVWNIYHYFIKRYIKILTHLRTYNQGHPVSIDAELWDDILKDMIVHLNYMDEEYVMEHHPDLSYEDVMKLMNEHKNCFFHQFNEWFYDLWD